MLASVVQRRHRFTGDIQPMFEVCEESTHANTYILTRLLAYTHTTHIYEVVKLTTLPMRLNIYAVYA